MGYWTKMSPKYIAGAATISILEKLGFILTKFLNALDQSGIIAFSISSILLADKSLFGRLLSSNADLKL